MSKAYYVRRDNVITAKLSGQMVRRFFEVMDGEWKPKSFKNGCTVNAFVSTEDQIFGCDGLQLFFDKDMYIYAPL